MSRLLCLLIATACFSAPLHAQYVGFNQKEIRELRRVVHESRRDSVAAEVAKAYDSIKKVAALALAEAPNPIDTIRTEVCWQAIPKKQLRSWPCGT